MGPIHVLYYFLFSSAWPKSMQHMREIKEVWFGGYGLVHFRPLGGSPKLGLADGVGQWEPTMFKGKNGFEQKL